MISILKRFFRIAEAKTHAAIDRMEDPIKMTEQGIRDLRKDLDMSMRSLAEAKAALIRLRRDHEEKNKLADSYENKAILLLKKSRSGDLSVSEAERLASAALAKKEEVLAINQGLGKRMEQHEKQTQGLEMRIQDLKNNIVKWEGELVTLKARSKVAGASRRLNEQLAQVNNSGTVALLEKMKAKVSEDEALADSYAEMASLPSRIDDEIRQALGDSSAISAGQKTAPDSLAALKSRLNMD